MTAAEAAAAMGPLRTALAAVFIAVGVFFLTVGTVGILRLPDVYNRMHASSKAATLGAASVFLAGLVVFGPEGAGLISLVGIVFLFLTAPTGAHLISRAAEKMGVEFYGEELEWPTTGDFEGFTAAEAEAAEVEAAEADTDATGEGN